MLYDISVLWIWLFAALGLGIIVGWATDKPGAQGPWLFGWFRGALVAFAVGLVVAWLRWLPGKLGLWLEIALLDFAAYVVGCVLGGVFRLVFVTPRDRAAPGARPFWAHRPGAGVAPLRSAAPPQPPRPKALSLVRAAPEPAVIARVEGEEKHEGQRPVGFVAPRGGKADDLKRIKGIGPQNEGRLHALGVWHFAQIAAWTRDNVRWVGSYLAFPGRIDREKWIVQAQALAGGGETAFSMRVESGELAKSHDGGSLGQDNIADLSRIKPHS